MRGSWDGETVTGVITPPARTLGASRGGTNGGFRTDVQALRGLAVVAVVAYHAEVLPGGFVGVDVFFVISGFVIGRVLVSRLSTENRLSLRDFYTRRARRLFPALAVLVSVVVLLAPLLAPVGAVASTARTGAAASTFHANFYLFGQTRGGYFGSVAEWNALLHTWSLSVEEQFYFVIPALFAGLWWLGRRVQSSVRLLALGVALVAVISFALCVALTYSGGAGSDGARWAFFSPLPRAWEFLAGVALVLAPTVRLSRGTGRLVLGAGLVLIGVATIGFSDSTRFPGVAAVVPVLGTAMAIWAGSCRGTSTSAKPTWFTTTERLGDISYSWYLWHWPLIVFAAAYWPTAGRLPLVGAAVVSLVPAWWSYRFLEQRFRTPASGAPRGGFKVAVVCVTVPLVASLASIQLSRSLQEVPVLADAADNRVPHLAESSGCNRYAPLGSAERTSCSWGEGESSVVLIGDSNADALSEALVGAADRAGAELSIAVLRGCPIADVIVESPWSVAGGRKCRQFLEGTVEHLRDHPPAAVIIANGTDKYVFDDSVALVDPTDGRREETHEGKEALLQEGLTRSLRELVALDVPVAVIETVPKPWAADLHLDQRSCSSALLVTAPERCSFPAFDVPSKTRVANQIEQSATGAAGAVAWDLTPSICPSLKCAGDTLPTAWSEPEHITASTATSLAPLVAPLLVSLLDQG